MSKKRRSQNLNSADQDDKSFVDVLIAKIGLVGTIVAAVISVIGVSVTAYFGYLGIKTQTLIPLRATQTAEALLTPITVNVSPPTLDAIPSDTVSPFHTVTPTVAIKTALPTLATSPTLSVVVPTANSNVITDTFEGENPDPNLWQSPTNASIIFIEDDELVFRVTPEQAIDGAYAELSSAPQAYPIRNISFTITMRSFAREGEGGVGLRVFMSNGPDHNVSITHDETNAAIELGLCKQQHCTGQYEEYQHPESTHVKENEPTNVHFAWDGNALSLYVDGNKRAAVAARDTPITDFQFSLFATPGGAFEAAVDNFSITYASQ